MVENRLWASANGSPILVCGEGGREATDHQRSDKDWEYGVRFKYLAELADYMKKSSEPWTRLAICAHGQAGVIDIESVQSGSFSTQATLGEELSKMLTTATFEKFKPNLVRINDTLSKEAQVLFMSCDMGKDQTGSDLLKLLSKEAFKGRKVVAFTRVGTTYQRIRVISGGCAPTTRCHFPGMKVGDNVVQSGSEEIQEGRRQLLLNAPWADEHNMYAKVAMNGELVKDPEGSLVKINPLDQLIGVWSFEIGDWRGVVVFEGAVQSGSGKVYWAEHIGAKKHYGSWKAKGSTISWEFDDDDKDWRRLFEVKIEKAISAGNITIKSVPHGFFKIVNNR